MTRVERRLAIRTGALGIALALIVVALDYSDMLVALERWCYDRRARYCQFYTPPPSEQFVHLDIDDPTLDNVGHWPWTGTTLGELMDEVCHAGPKVVTMDFFWSERQDPVPITQKRPDGTQIVVGQIDHNTNFAAAIARCGNVILPASLAAADPLLPLQAQVTDLLIKDLELSESEVVQALAQQKITGESVARQVGECFNIALKNAMFTRIEKELAAQAQSQEDLTRKLLPKHTDQFASLRRELERARVQWEALQAVHNFTRKDANVPVYPVQKEIASIPELMSSAKATAFVDYFTESDGVVRAVPLWVAAGGNVYPQMGLAAACAMMDIDPRDAQRVIMSADAVTLVPPQGAKIVIPLHDMHSRELGQLPGMFNVPWRGPSASKERRDWERMYDDAKEPHHVVMRDVYEIVLTRRAMMRNVSEVDEAFRSILQQMGDPRLEEFKSHPPRADDIDARVHLAIDLQKAIANDPILPAFVGKKPQDFTDEKDQLVAAQLDAIKHLIDQNDQLVRQRAMLASKLKDKAVFVGSVATALADFVPTSLHARCPGVVIHGLIFNGIMTGEMWRTAPRWVTLLFTFMAGILSTVVVAVVSPRFAVFVVTLLLGCYVAVNSIWLFDRNNMIVGLAGPLVGFSAVWAGCTLMRLLVEGYERALAMRRFRNYVDPRFVNYVLEHPEKRMDGELREVTVVYTDLVGFTTLSERLGERVVPMLNSYFDVMVPIIERHEGYRNKFLGDGIMFFYGGLEEKGNHAALAVSTILEMQTALAEFNEGLKAQDLPPLGMRAGVSTGPMIVGNAGSKDQADYTVLGDYSNLGARLESANKALGTSNLLSVRTVELMGDQFLVRPIGRLQVVGRDSYIMTFEAFCAKGSATERHLKLVAMTEKIVHAYVEGRFRHCLQAIDEMEAAFGPDKLTDIYREWSTKHLNGEPAEEFVGQIVLESK